MIGGVIMNEKAVAYVDGSFMTNIGYGSGVYLIYKDTVYEITGMGDVERYMSMQNVSGEILATMLAIRKAIKLGCKEILIYHDYIGIGHWANDTWRANKDETKDYKQFIQDARKKIEIHFEKVKAHSGNFGNVQADRLAAETLNLCKTKGDKTDL